MKFPSIVVAGSLLILSTTHAAPFIPSNLDQLPLNDRRLIELNPGQKQWMSQAEIDSLIRHDVHFMDITDHPDLDSPALQSSQSSVDLPRVPRMAAVIYPMLNDLSTDKMREFLSTFSGFWNRYYKSEHGTKSAEFLYETVSAIARESGKNISVSKFGHSWPQFSIIARFEGQSGSEDTVIVGAHQDSINQRNREGRAPGADDDGSGTTSILEAFRVLAMSQSFKPDRPVEFHWYSAEELGLLGSQAVAAAYKKQGRKVVAMLQNDMTGYVHPNFRKPGQRPHFGIVTDFTDPSLTSFVKQLIGKYADMEFKDTKCGYACSDHASWLKAGYRAAFPFEGLFTDHSPYVHTPQDDITTVDFDHMKEYSKLSLSFAVELSHEE